MSLIERCLYTMLYRWRVQLGRKKKAKRKRKRGDKKEETTLSRLFVPSLRLSHREYSFWLPLSFFVFLTLVVHLFCHRENYLWLPLLSFAFLTLVFLLFYHRNKSDQSTMHSKKLNSDGQTDERTNG